MEAIKKSNTMQQLVSFILGKEVFAVDVMRVQGVERVGEITSIPGMPAFVEGIINLRESIIPVVDLRKRFFLDARDYGKETRIIVLELNTQLVVGMIVDSVKEVMQVEPEKMDKMMEMGCIRGGVVNKKFISGVAKHDGRLVIVLDIEKIFSEEEEEAMKSV